MNCDCVFSCDVTKNIQYIDRTYAVKNFYPPTSKLELERFLNFTRQFQIFIKDYSRKEELFLELIHENDWNWNRTYGRKFNSLKRFLCIKPILQNPYSLKPYKLTVNASAYGVGSILTQERKGIDMPVGYFSKYLEERERWLNSQERENLAIYYSILNFQQYLQDEKFFVISSCPYIETYSNRETLDWMNFCQNSDFEIIYCQTGLAECAETLSHNPMPTKLIDSEYQNNSE